MADLAKRKDTNQSRPGQESLVPATKLARNRRLPATMITPGGKVETSKKKTKAVTKGKKKRSDASKEKALERMEKIETRVRGREEKKVSTYANFHITDRRRRGTAPRTPGNRQSLASDRIDREAEIRCM